ncbi:putative Gnk2-like domain-containing protein [Helianthus annuus]|nr:putative Gnk2-like domain-containing protein [Helianthus annuus]
MILCPCFVSSDAHPALAHGRPCFSICILYIYSTQAQLLCNENSNTATTEIANNINTVLTRLVQATSTSGYSVAAFGSGQARVFGLAQCRGDVPPEECSTCIQNIVKEINTTCPNRTDARLWYDRCYIRYNTKNFFGQVDVGYGTYFSNPETVADPETFNEALTALMNQNNDLASRPENKGLGKGQTRLSDSMTIYAASQCIRDLAPSSCRVCLEIAVGDFPTYCANKKGCRVYYNSCYVQYEFYPV